MSNPASKRSSHRDYKLFLQDILDSIDKIQSYIGTNNEQEFYAHGMLVDAVVRNIEIIGEAIRNIPPDLKKRHPNIEWRRINAMRNILVHDYFGVDVLVIWQVTHNELPGLQHQIAAILAAENAK